MIDKNYLRKLALDIKINLSDKEVEEMEYDFEILNKQLELLNKINTDNVEEMIYPFEEETYYLREDIVDNTITQEEALSNAYIKKEGHFVVKKVIK